jgi:GAF domain
MGTFPTGDPNALSATSPVDRKPNPERPKALKISAIRFVGRQAPYVLLALSLLVTLGTAAYMAHATREPDRSVPVALLIGLAVSCVFFGIARTALRAQMADAMELNRTQKALAKHAERLRILQEIDRALIAAQAPEAIGAAVIQPLRELLEVPRAIVNIFDLAAGEVEWLAAAGRRRIHVGPGVRYSIRLMGDVEALRRGKPQIIDTRLLPPGPEVDALLASGVEVYMVMPMIAAGELIGALSFGGGAVSLGASRYCARSCDAARYCYRAGAAP